MTRPLVSVVSASYNALEGLKATIASVAGQSFADVEHVIVDGGSEDGTPAYLASLGEQVRWISEPDEGIYDALNKGIAMAQGDYVIVLQAGDTFAGEGALAMAAGHLRQGPDMASFDVRFERGDGSHRTLRGRPLQLLTNFRITSPHQGLFVARALYEQIGTFTPTMPISADYDFLLRAKRAGASLVAVPQTVAIMPADGVSSRTDWPSFRRKSNDDRRAHLRNARSGPERLAYRMFWLAYWPYLRLKQLYPRLP